MKVLLKDMLFISLLLAINSISITKLPQRFSTKPDFSFIQDSNTSVEGLNCFYGYEPEGLTGIATPIRLNRNFDVECLSLDGKNCVWNTIKTGAQCFDYMLKNEGKFTPLTCGKMHKSIYGIEGYGTAGHWCEIGKNFYFNTWHCSEETSIPTGLRIDWVTKNVECLSTNGKECVWNDFAACQRAKTSKRNCKYTTPFLCGESNIKYFNGTNPYYDSLPNWCKAGNLFFFGSTNWICGGDSYGQDTPFRYNEFGDVECFSLNGKDCAWGKGTSKVCTDYIEQNLKNVNPLRCGSMHNAVHGVDGYSNKNHWCRKLMDNFVLTSRKN
jgi:hypothetical protein